MSSMRINGVDYSKDCHACGAEEKNLDMDGVTCGRCGVKLRPDDHKPEAGGVFARLLDRLTSGTK